MQTLVTGATGFIGESVARRLAQMGWDVHAIVRVQSKSDRLSELLGRGNVHVHDGSMGEMLEIVKRSRPDVVFHIASLFLSQHKTEDVIRLVRSNIEFPAQLAEAMAVTGIKRLINTGTSWQHCEDGEYNPVNLYSASKQAFLDILRFYTETKAFNVINLELFDTYGPGDTRPKLFSLLRNSAATGQKLDMSPGKQLIDLVYIDDVVTAFEIAAERIQTTTNKMETYGVTSTKPLPLRSLVELWQRISGKHPNINWGARPYRPREVMQTWTRAAILPSWQAKTPLEEGIRRMEQSGGELT